MTASPRDAAPRTVEALRQVEETIAALEHIGDLPVAQQFEHLSEAQELLAAVLRGDSAPQTNLPGMA